MIVQFELDGSLNNFEPNFHDDVCTGFTRLMQKQINYFQFKQLINSLENSNVLIRFRLISESWTGFSKVILASENALMIKEGITRRILMNLRNVIEFEIDQPHLDYRQKINT